MPAHNAYPAAARRIRNASLVALCAALTTASCGSPEASSDNAGGDAETVRNCDIDVEISAENPPERVFAVYQPAIEMAHALGISDRLVGTAYLDAKVIDDYADVQSEQKYYPEIPSREEMLSRKPDFVLSGFNDVFTDGRFDTRASLRELGVESWIFSPLCPSEDGRGDQAIDPSTVTMDSIYGDLRDLGTVFGVEDRAEEVVADMEQTVADVEDAVQDAGSEPEVMVARPSDDGFRAAAASDFATEMIDLAGGTNAAADVKDERHANFGTEEIIARDPDHIFVDVCCDADMTAADAAPSVEEITSDPALANVTAVEEGNVHEWTFADRSAGVRSARVVADIARTIHPDQFDTRD
ncbi:ABC transporter substrate-binding protein [Haloactinospora alba]|nr:ABC transporter substrate-binding protein [Haloactinospora alba]